MNRYDNIIQLSNKLFQRYHLQLHHYRFHWLKLITSKEQIALRLPRQFQLLSPVRHFAGFIIVALIFVKAKDQLHISNATFSCHLGFFVGLERSCPSLPPHHALHKRQALVSPPILFSALNPAMSTACQTQPQSKHPSHRTGLQ